jgi:hypothetical protein
MNVNEDLHPLPMPTPDPEGVDSEVRDIAARCRVTEAAAPALARQGLAVAEGSPWPFRPGDEAAPIGSAGWWRYVGSVLAVASNTGVISMSTCVGILGDAYEIAVARGGAR